MAVDRVQLQDVIASQIPTYVRDDFPLLVDFLEEYYIAQETQGATLDLIENLDKYVKVDQLANLKTETLLAEDLNVDDTTITLSSETNFTYGFPDENGLILIDDEIIKYGTRTDTTFEDCVRGFSGVTQYIDTLIPDKQVFKQSNSAEHTTGATVKNLSILFLQEFFTKLKTQITPGFENRTLADTLNQKNFIKSADTFYKAKGTDESFKILFKAIYGVDVDILKPNNFLTRPSDASYIVSQDYVIEGYVGDIEELKNRTIFQNATGARGTVNKVEKLNVDGDFWQISIDTGYQRDIDVDGTIYGKFEPNSKTKLLNNVGVGATILDVDSTIDFASSGSLSIIDDNGDEQFLSYTDKNLTQFIGVTTTTTTISKKTDIRENDYSYANIGVGTDNQVRFRILSTLKNIEYLEDNFGFSKGDRITLKTIGVEDDTIKSDWFYNVKSKLDVKSIEVSNATSNIYRIVFYEDHDLVVNYGVVLTNLDLNTTITGVVDNVEKTNCLNVRFSGTIPVATLGQRFSLENQVLKGNSSELPSITTINANVLNTYIKQDKYLIASNSIPNYEDEIRSDDKVVSFTGSADGDGTITLSINQDHGFFNGDAVYYKGSTTTTTTSIDGGTFVDTTTSKFTNVEEGVYFVYRKDAFSIQLANSKSELYEGKFITPTGSVTDNTFTYYPFYEKPLTGQKLFREVTDIVQEAGTFPTKPGKTGILLNGVEIENYKSDDVIYYGNIESFEVTSPGKGYDIINPPILTISDGSGSGASGIVQVSGELTDLRITNPGFDFVETPKVTIEGGSPTRPAVVGANLKKVEHKVPFNAGINLNNLDGGVSIVNDIIGFSTFHNLRENEQIIYDPNTSPVAGLGTNQTYFARLISDTQIKLHSSFSECIAGINTVSINGFGNGQQSFSSVDRKQVVSSLVISDPGSGYKNQETKISGLSTSLNTLTVNSHGYSTEEKVRYCDNGSDLVGGLSTTTNYIVKNIDTNTIQLFSDLTNLSRNIPVDIESDGGGCFNYIPITVTIEGLVGVGSFGHNTTCTVQPIFRGSITGADVLESGVGYGSSEIFNFDRKPNVTLDSGTGAQLQPIVENGSITEVVVRNGGSGYNSPPDLTVTLGSYCKLTPVVENGSIKSVIVTAGGINYRNDSLIIVTPAGQEGAIAGNINQWTINKFEQKFAKLTDDDCIITEGSIDNTLQLAHLYAPRNIRSVRYGNKSNLEAQYQYPDLYIEQGIEVDSKYHSPIIGWSYCGSPIYGPYGYETPDGGAVKRMISGYELEAGPNRPPLNLYPLGFFVQDYVFRGTGDLNESNGRFCVTPEFPKGRFCYFTTIRKNTDSGGPFNNLKRPVFPYLIGNTFQHKPNDFNFKKLSNHVDYDLVSNDWRRITSPYKINTNYGGYDYIFSSNDVKEQVIEVTGISKGSVDNVGIFTGGVNYKVNEKVVFKGDTNGKAARGVIEKIDGKKVKNVNIQTQQFVNIEFLNVGVANKFVGFLTAPHNLVDNTRLKIDGLSDYFAGFDKTYNIGINSGSYVLLDDVDTSANTGIVTYFSVGGAFQYPFMRPNDIVSIESEKVKILNSDPLNNRVRVLRAQQGTVGASHTGNVSLFQDPRSFAIEVGTLKTTKLLKTNTEFYFDPSESLGIGTETTIGAGNTINFSNPGAGITNIFVQNQHIYLPNHTFKINDNVTYHTNGGNSIQVYNGKTGVAYTTLESYTPLYVAPIDRNFIGISSVKIGLTTTGYVGLGSTADVGLFYFTNLGTNVYHSFKTNFDNVVTAKAERTNVTVSTASSHGLFVNDNVVFSLNPKNQRTITVKYDDFNRRIVFDPQTFVAGNVDVQDNTIGFTTGFFKTGDKVIHTSSSVSGGLVNEKMYYVVVHSPDRIKLVEEKYQLDELSPNFIDITSAGQGTLSKINPVVSADSNIKFDLSDPSLSFTSNSIKYPAFKMEIFNDALLINQYLSSGVDADFNVKTKGIVGTDGELTIDVKDIPFSLYYKFSNVNQSFVTQEKLLVVDDDVKSYNTIFKSLSILDGNHSVTSIGTTTFTYELDTVPSIISYNETTADAEYSTTSSNAYGAINKVNLVDNNYGYVSLPGISSIKSGIGTGAILFAESRSIGRIRNQKFQSNNIGWNYPTDRTLKPTANLPEIVEVNPLASFERIGITSSGVDYLVAPDLVVRDGVTDSLVDCDLKYELGDPEVTIIANSRGFFPTTPRIITINNSNGYSIGGVTLTDKLVKLDIVNQFNSDSEYPFSIGSKIYVEGINVGSIATAKGYNSDQYKHKLFTVVGVKTNAGGSGAYVEYSLEDDLTDTESPGSVVSFNSARVIAENHLPTFDVSLGRNKFLTDETVSWDSKKGLIDEYNNDTDILKVKTQFDIPVGDTLIGESSKTRGIVVKKWDFKADINVGAGTTINYGWTKNTGFLNDPLQRMPNNEYYQRFSYSLKSTIPLDVWDNTVGALNHTAGFKKFSDLQVISTPEETLEVNTNDTELSFIVDCIGEGDLNCWHDYDNAKENIYSVNGKDYSDTILFENAILTDYFESKGNRVLRVDDVSEFFNSNERAEAFSAVANFDTSVKFAKSLFYIQDTTFTDERQFQVTTAIVDDDLYYITTYAELTTFPRLGDIDIQVTEDNWEFEFHPIKFEYNNYEVSSFTFAFEPAATGVANTSFGDVIFFDNQEVNIPTGATTNIVSVGTSYRSAKVLNMIVSDDHHHFAEINIIHDNSTVSFVEYNNLDEGPNPYAGGIGTYSAAISGSNLLLKFHPNAGIAATSYSQVVSTARGNSTTGFVTMTTAKIGSAYTSISSSGSPSAHVLSSYDTVDPGEKYSASYQIITVEDTGNGDYETFEFGLINSKTITTQNYVEFGNVTTNSSLGTIGVNTTGDNVQVTFTPNAGIAVEVKSFFSDLREIEPNTKVNKIEMNDGDLRTVQGNYFGTKSAVTKDFNLFHNGDPIFQRQFDGSSTSGVNTITNQIALPNHFFQSGEAVKYEVTGTDTRIQIVNTDFGGSVGSTTLLPTDLFVVKFDDAHIGFSTTAVDAQAINPTTIDLTNVGTGNSHFVTATKQNTKMLVTIDNMLQSPVAKTDITATLQSDIIFDTFFKTSGITSISSNDIVKIDNEFMRVTSVTGTGTTIFVERPILGTEIEAHTVGATIEKFVGNYTVSDNKINFVSAPYGKNPLSTTTNPPDSRDWTGITTSSSFSGRVFLKRGVEGSTTETYNNNFVFDDVSDQFTGLTSEFTLKSDGVDVSGIATNSIISVNNIFQSTQGVQSLEVGEYQIFESAGVSTAQFSGVGTPLGYDVNRGGLPIGGMIVSVGSIEGLGYQPLVSAGGTAVVSTAGTIQSVSIGNSGSGYRTGVATAYNVGVQTYVGVVPVLEHIGTAIVTGGHITSINITNPGSGYTNTNAPVVVIDQPLNYTGIPLEYSSTSSGSGSQATIDIKVGQGSSVIEFEINDFGYGFKKGEVLTIPTGGTTGIPTDTSYSFSEFQISIQEIYSDNFLGYSPGEFQVLDRIDSKFNGIDRVFPLTLEGNPVSIKAARDSNIEVDQTLLIFINDILQVPGKSYVFEGGSQIVFNEAPKGPGSGIPEGDTSRILFYRGAGASDVVFVDVLETVKIGDTLQLNADIESGQSIVLNEDKRVVTGITTVDSVQTNAYPGPGLSNDKTLTRPLTWCKQTVDRRIDGQFIGKDRPKYEPIITPTSYLLQPVSTGSTQIYVDNVRPLFDGRNEGTVRTFQNKICVISQDVIVGATASATVSVAGTVTGYTITNAGSQYTSTPTVSIAGTATATATISGGSVTALTTTDSGGGYTEAPLVLIEEPKLIKENINVTSYSGDDGIIVGFGTTSYTGKTQVVFDFFIPTDSFLRDASLVGSAITVSGISTGDFFTCFGTNMVTDLSEIISVKTDNVTTIGVTTTFADSVYQAERVEVISSEVIGIGTTVVARVFANISGISSISFSSSLLNFDSTLFTFDSQTVEVYSGGIASSHNMGKFSWGKIALGERVSAQSFNFYGLNGHSGISSSGLVQRYNPLKYKNYI